MNALPPWQAGLARAAANALSPSGRYGSLLVLIFHRVLPGPDPVLPEEPDAETFAAQLDVVRNIFQVIGLREAVERLRTSSLPARAACITFDDGYADNAEVAAPLLAARKLPAAFFVATGFIGGGRMWNDTITEALRRAPEELDLRDLGLGVVSLREPGARPRAIDRILDTLKYEEPGERERRAESIAERVGCTLPPQPMMCEAQIRRLAGMGMEIGAHSVSHPILTRLADDEARREVEQSKAVLEGILGAPVHAFAYPNGRPGRDYVHRHTEMVRRAGFRCAVTTAWGSARRDSDCFQLPRIAPWDRTPRRYGARMLLSYFKRRPPAV